MLNKQQAEEIEKRTMPNKGRAEKKMSRRKRVDRKRGRESGKKERLTERDFGSRRDIKYMTIKLEHKKIDFW